MLNGSPEEDQVPPACLVPEPSKVGTKGLSDLTVPQLTAREGTVVIRATDCAIYLLIHCKGRDCSKGY